MPELTVSVLDAAEKKDRRKFVQAAWNVFRPDDNWAPPLISEEVAQLDSHRNPFLARGHVRLFVARRGNQIVGRVAYLEGPYLVGGYQQGMSCFGFFACQSDNEAAISLLDLITDYAQSRGRSTLVGPFNPTLYDSPGILEDGFDVKPSFLTSFNPPYYRDLLQAAGFSRFKELLAFEIDVTETVPDTLLRAEQLAFRCGIRIRHADFKSLSPELERFFEVHWRAISANWGEVQFTEEQRNYTVKRLRPLLRKELVVFAEYANQPVGVALAIPHGYAALKTLDGRLGPIRLATAIYQLYKSNSVRVPLIGVVPQHRRRGIDGALIAHLWREGYKVGVRKCDLSWVLADNRKMVNTITHLGAIQRRTWGLYSKRIS